MKIRINIKLKKVGSYDECFDELYKIIKALNEVAYNVHSKVESKKWGKIERIVGAE